MTTKLIGFGAATVALVAAAAPAAAREKRITPYIEAAQVLTADVRSGDVLTYSELSAGVDATIQTRRVQITVGYRYSHRFAWDKKVGDGDSHTGLARGSVRIAPGLSLDGGAVATLARSDIRGPAPTLIAANQLNSSQVYSGDIGPSFATHVGPIGVSSSYRFGVTKAEAPDLGVFTPGTKRRDVFDTSTRHLAQASAGVKAGAVLPVGLSVGGAYEREDTSQLDNRYEGKYGRGDAVLPVTPTVALTAGVGYESIEISQRDVVLDAAGNAFTDTRGRFITNKASPRRIAYETDGIFYDAGVLYRPSPRTTFQARVGRRYDSMTYTGSLSYQMNSSVGFNVGVYDGIQSFGRQLRGAVAALPTSFVTSDDPLGQTYNGCVFGTNGAGAGGCLNSPLQSLTTANYRARGIDAVLVASRGGTILGAGLGYSNRKFLVPTSAPGLAVANDSSDQSGYAQFFVGRALDSVSSITANLSANVADSDVPGSPIVYGGSASGSYQRRFGRVSATASLGVSGFDTSQTAMEIQALARLGLRYGF